MRELRAEVARWVVFCEGRVDLEDLSPEIRAASSGSGMPRPGIEIAPRILGKGGATRPLSEILDDVEQRVIASALTRNEGNLSKTARELGIDRNTLKRKLPGRRA